MKEGEEGSRERRWAMADGFLRARMLEFMGQKRFRHCLEKAVELWRESYQGELPDNEVNVIRFADWVLHDHRLEGFGASLAELLYKEQGIKLDRTERKLLEARIRSSLGLYEVTAVKPGTGVALEDLFTGGRSFAYDVSASGALVKWDVVLARLLPVGDRLTMEGAAFYMSQAHKQDLVNLGKELFEQYLGSNPGASWKQFMKEQGFLFNSYRTRARKRIENMKILTFEGDEVVISRAVFKVEDPDKVVAVLGQIKGIEKEEVVKDGRGRIKEAHFRWAGRIKSVAPTGKSDDMTAVVSTTLVGGQTGQPIVSLGDIDVDRSHLVLECISRVRLEKGKALLERRLGELIEHLDSSFQDPRDMRGEGSVGVEDGPDRESTKAMIQEFLDQHYRNWADTPLPLLGGKTPRQAFKTRKGRMQVEELLKDLENAEERRRKAGEAGYDVNRIRTELEGGWSGMSP